MEIGLLYDFRNPPQWRLPSAELYAETLDHIQAAESLGFPLVWLTEHHLTEDGYLPSVLAAACAVAQRTSRVTIGTNVLLLPLQHPLRVAEDAAVADIFSNGRLRLGVGLGYKLDEFAAFGVNRKHRPSLMDEGLQILKQAWADGPFSFSGRHHQLENVDVMPKPVQRPGIPLWVAGRAEAPVRRAARYGDGLIAVGTRELFEIYSRAWAEFGRSGTPQMAAFAGAWPAADPEAAWAELGDHLNYRSRNYGQWYGEAADLPQDQRMLEMSRAEQPVSPARAFQTPDEIVGEIKSLEAVGVTSMIYFATFPGARPSATLPLLETLARDILPAVASA